MAEENAKEASFEDKAKEFNAELITLIDKYKIGIVAMPFITNEGKIAARMTLFDDKKAIEEKKELEAVEGGSEEPKVTAA